MTLRNIFLGILSVVVVLALWALTWPWFRQTPEQWIGGSTR